MQTTHELDRIIRGRMCSGCGACAFVGAAHGVTMIDVASVGRRPSWGEDLPGTVVEEGTHADLMAAGGLYAELYRLQSHSDLGVG